VCNKAEPHAAAAAAATVAVCSTSNGAGAVASPSGSACSQVHQVGAHLLNLPKDSITSTED
jgi:hypothetical protein